MTGVRRLATITISVSLFRHAGSGSRLLAALGFHKAAGRGRLQAAACGSTLGSQSTTTRCRQTFCSAHSIGPFETRARSTFRFAGQLISWTSCVHFSYVEKKARLAGQPGSEPRSPASCTTRWAALLARGADAEAVLSVCALTKLASKAT